MVAAMNGVGTSVVATQGGATSTTTGTNQDGSIFAQLLQGAEATADSAPVSGTVAKPAQAPVATESDTDEVAAPIDLLAILGVAAPIAPAPTPAPAVDTAASAVQSTVQATVQPATTATAAAPLPEASVVNDQTVNVDAQPAAAAATTLPAAPALAAAPDTVSDATAETTDASLPQANSIASFASGQIENKIEKQVITHSSNIARTDPNATETKGSGSRFDLQWLQSVAHRADNAVSAQPAVNADTSTLIADDSSANVATQNVLADMLQRAAPMVGKQRQDEMTATAIETDRVNIAATPVTTQPANTQLADDAKPLEMPRHQLHSQVGSQHWASELGNKLTMMASKDTQSATLYMTPADMGPVQVRIETNQDQASVWFTAEHAETRSALEQSLPKLREMFSAQGMSLTDAGVFGDRPRQQQAADHGTSFTPFSSPQFGSDEALQDTSMVRSISLGLLDAYA
ncbi:MAG: flagellar hook-length control protein FliK [Steroidobacteraceae bacterium]